MSWWVRLECDGNREGQRCRSGFMARTEDVAGERERARREGWRRLADVLSPETNVVMEDEHLCPEPGHDEEHPAFPLLS